MLRGLFRKRQETDLDDELHAAVEELIERQIQAGHTPDEARRLALIEFGGVERVKEECRHVRSLNWLDVTVQDLRFAIRTMRRHSLITAVALVSLALGIGANTAIFSFVNSVLLRPLPFPEPNRLVAVGFSPRNAPRRIPNLSHSECLRLKGATAVFDGFGCYAPDVWASIAEDQSGTLPPERLRGQWFTAGLAKALGVSPVVGRWFMEEDENEGGRPVIVISHALWVNRFGTARDVLGKTLRFDGEAYEVIGVMPESFELIDSEAAYWIPFRNPAGEVQSSARMFGGVARLAAGVDIRRAQAELDAVALRLEQEFPETNKGVGILTIPLDEVFVASRIQDSAPIILGAVIFVLLIACANVAGLLLAQGAAQQRELAVRAALGSSRARIVRQLMTHSILLAFMGGGLGLATGWAGIQLLKGAIPPGLQRHIYEAQLDGHVLLFTMAVSLTCGLIVGIVPALQVSGAQPVDALRESGRNVTAGVARHRLRSAFVIVQIALAFVLMVGTGLMLNSLIRLAQEPLGFDPDNLVTLDVYLPDSKFRRPTTVVLPSGGFGMQTDPDVYRMSEQMQLNLAAIPHVTSASGIAMFPPNSGALTLGVRIDNRQFAEAQRTQFLPIMPDYFEALEVPVLQGREFTSQDRAGSVQVAVINDAMANRYWPGESPLGKLVRIDSPMLPDEPSREVIGIVKELKQFPGQQGRSQLYIPFSQLAAMHDERLSSTLRTLTFIVRTPVPPSQLEVPIRTAVGGVDESQAVARIRTMEAMAFNSLRTQSVYAALLGVLGMIAVLLAVSGVYGIMAHMVAQRTNEIGIRMALGANPEQVRRLIIGRGLVLVSVGLASGAVAASGITRMIQSNLFGVSATDPLTFALGLGLLGGIGLIACYLPARRASRIDPIAALRHD